MKKSAPVAVFYQATQSYVPSSRFGNKATIGFAVKQHEEACVFLHLEKIDISSIKNSKLMEENIDDEGSDWERACDGKEPDTFEMVPSEYRPIPPQPQPAEMTRWPQMTTLIRDHADAVLRILNACEECEVVLEVAASDSGNVKGNKWVRLHDVVFGGRDDSSRGLIPQFPVIPLPSKFKKKVVSIWQFGVDETKVPDDIHRLCVRLLQAHQETVKAQADSNKAAKEKYAELAGKMREYEDSVGALPPGAKVPPPPGARPDEGGGRLNHSTNLQARQPAAYGFLNHQRVSNASSASSLPGLPAMPANNDRPTTPASSSAAGTTPLSSGQVNSQALQNLNRLGSTFDSVVARLLPSTPNTSSTSEITLPPQNSNKRKHQAMIDKARKKKKELEEQISFMRPMKDDTASNKVHFCDITKQYIDASKEVINLISQTNIDEE